MVGEAERGDKIEVKSSGKGRGGQRKRKGATRTMEWIVLREGEGSQGKRKG